MMMLVGAAIAAVVVAVPGSVSAQFEAEFATGCLTSAGRITDVAIGDLPTRPCRPRETEITLRLGGDDQGDVHQAPFLVTLDGDGSEQIIATSGPLELFARCELNVPYPPDNPDRLINVASLVVTSLEADWVATSLGKNPGPRPAGDEITLLSSGDNLLSDVPKYVAPGVANNVGSALAPDGSYLGVAADTVGFGTAIFDHDCVAAGMTIVTANRLP